MNQDTWIITRHCNLFSIKCGRCNRRGFGIIRNGARGNGALDGGRTSGGISVSDGGAFRGAENAASKGDFPGKNKGYFISCGGASGARENVFQIAEGELISANMP